jgi:hypothetical protein
MMRRTSMLAVGLHATRVALCAAKMTYEARLSQLEADPENPLAQPEYKLLQAKLAEYMSMQGAYAVKQSDIERTRRAANVCGLDFPEPKRREE